jgi:hypothetical protein
MNDDADNIAARIDAVARYFSATEGEAAGKARREKIHTSEDLHIAEQELTRSVAARTPKLPPAQAPQHDTRSQHGRVTEEEFQKMSARERLDYARQFLQEQFNGGQR